MKRVDYQCKFCNHIVCIKWYDSKSVMLLGSHLEELTSVLTVQRRLKGSSSKILVNCPNDIKLYNRKMVGVDLMDQLKSAYQLDRRSKFQFYLRLFFDLIDVAVVNAFIVYEKLENEDQTHKEFKICIALKLIASFVSRKLSCPNHGGSKRTKGQKTRPDTSITFANFLGDNRRCTVCSQAGKRNRTFVMRSLCDLALCLQKERNFFLQYLS